MAQIGRTMSSEVDKTNEGRYYGKAGADRSRGFLRAAIIGLFFFGLLLRLYPCTQDFEYILRSWFLHEDCFYSLEIARNIALGKGPTHDGTHLTNGYQPMLVFGAYNFYVFGSWHFIRYFFPIFVVLTLYAGLFFDGLVRMAKEYLRMPRILAAVVLVAAYQLAFCRPLHQCLFMVAPGMINVFGFHKMAEIVDSTLEPDAKIGAFQAGTLVYFADHTVVPLDGKVNPAALDALGKKELIKYIKEEGVDYLVDWDWVMSYFLKYGTERDAYQFMNLYKRVGVFVIYKVH